MKTSTTGFDFDTIKSWADTHERFKLQAAALADGAEGEELAKRLAPIADKLSAVAPVLARLKMLVDQHEGGIIAGHGTVAAPGLDGVAEVMNLLERLAIAEGWMPNRSIVANQVLGSLTQSFHVSGVAAPLAPPARRESQKQFLTLLNGLSLDQRIALLALIFTMLTWQVQQYREVAKDRAQPAEQRIQAELNAAAVGKILRDLVPETRLVRQSVEARASRQANSPRVAKLKANQMVTIEAVDEDWAHVSWRAAAGDMAGWVPLRYLKRIKSSTEAD